MKKLNILTLFLFIAFSFQAAFAQYHAGRPSCYYSLHTTKATPVQEPQTSVIADPVKPEETTPVAPNNGMMLTTLNTTGTAQSYPWLSDDGLRVYYTNGEQMYMASRSDINGKFSSPHEVCKGSNVMNDVTSGWLTPDELTIYVATTGDFYVGRRSSKDKLFTDMKKVKLVNAPSGVLFDASFTPDMNEMLMYNNGSGEAIIRFKKTGKDEYTYTGSINLVNPGVPTGGQLSRDGLRFFVPIRPTVSDDDRTLYVLSRTDMHAEFNTCELLQAAVEIKGTAYQPCVNADETRCVFVTGTGNLWNNNDLCEVSLVKKLPEVIAKTDDKVIDKPVEVVPLQSIIQHVDKVIVVDNVLPIQDVVNANANAMESNTATTNVYVPGELPKLEVNFAPNPFGSQTQIEVISPVSGYMRIEVYNASGQMVAVLYDGQTEKLKLITWVKGVLNNGVYTVKTIVEKNVVTKKIVICDVGPH